MFVAMHDTTQVWNNKWELHIIKCQGSGQPIKWNGFFSVSVTRCTYRSLSLWCFPIIHYKRLVASGSKDEGWNGWVYKKDCRWFRRWVFIFNVSTGGLFFARLSDSKIFRNTNNISLNIGEKLAITESLNWASLQSCVLSEWFSSLNM